MNERLREPTFLIMTALARGPLHGYGLITEFRGGPPPEDLMRLGPFATLGAAG